MKTAFAVSEKFNNNNNNNNSSTCFEVTMHRHVSRVNFRDRGLEAPCGSAFPR
jgi:hypothetical protein